MSAQTPRGAGNPVPVARPAYTLPQIKHQEDNEQPADDSWYSLTRESLRGWSTSLSVHGVLLLALAFWVLTPRTNSVRAFDTRLAGSEMGIEEGLTLTGGLNTEFDMSTAPEPVADSALTGMKPLELAALDPRLSQELSGAAKPSASGGVDNPNPGAGSGDGFGLARFGDGGENIRGVAVKVGDPQFTLLWDTEVDLDLHVIEPGGKEIYWEEPLGKRGGELDVDNTKGFGPENIFWMHENPETGERTKGQGPPGEYKWFIVYWGGFGGVPKPTRWKVRIKHDGKVTVVNGRFKSLNERSKTYTLRVDPPAGEAATAAETTSTK